MFGALSHPHLQILWWVVLSLVGAIFVALTFVQGGQTLLLTLARGETEKSMVVNSLGRKWELTFTTLVLFGGAFFAAFPLFYATSFGGAYWLWICILFTFIIQAVSYEYRRKPGNLLGEKTYEVFLFINGSLGIFLVGVALGSFFTGSHFALDEGNLVLWRHPLHGLEAAGRPFNLALGLLLVFLSRVLGSLYLRNNIDYPPLEAKLRRAALVNLLLLLPFLLVVLWFLVTMEGFAVTETGRVVTVEGKYLTNLLEMPVIGAGFLLGGLALVVAGALTARFSASRMGVWLAMPGAGLTALALFFIAGFNGTAFYPSVTDLQGSLTIHNASSSRYTLIVMSYIALSVPFILAYIAYAWRAMDARKFSADDVEQEKGNLY